MYRALLLILILGLTGCSQLESPPATPIPTPEVWRVAYVQELSWLLPGLQQCTQEIPNLGISVVEFFSIEMVDQKADIVLQWGDTDMAVSNAYRIGEDDVSVVVNRANMIEEISMSVLGQIYSGEISTWDEVEAAGGGEMHVWSYPEVTEIFQTWAERYPGVEVRNPAIRFAPDVSAMLEAIQEDTQAIGYLPTSWLDGIVKPLEISGVFAILEPIPVIALTASEPGEQQKRWLTCVQDFLD